MLNSDINQYVTQVAQASGSGRRRAITSCAPSACLSASALLALVITGCACWYIYRNLART
jgi:hypothetical protein